MISLFNLPNYQIDTSKFNHFLNGYIVRDFTSNFCKYVGYTYGCPVNSATSAIFLLAKYGFLKHVRVPAMIPPVVPHALINGDIKDFEFIDNTEWIGGAYMLADNVIDSAQEVIPRKPFLEDEICIYSFYPTKPVGSSDGGMICSDNHETIEFLKLVSNNGLGPGINSWDQEIKEIGWKMYLNSIQAYIANESLKTLDTRKRYLKQIRDIYNENLGYNNKSDHLYRIKVADNRLFCSKMKALGVTCGIHYRALHKEYNHPHPQLCPISEIAEKQTVSLPFHEKLTIEEIYRIIEYVKLYSRIS